MKTTTSPSEIYLRRLVGVLIALHACTLAAWFYQAQQRQPSISFPLLPKASAKP